MLRAKAINWMKSEWLYTTLYGYSIHFEGMKSLQRYVNLEFALENKADFLCIQLRCIRFYQKKQ